MLVEDIELTLAHVDLGQLDEVALMTLFCCAQSHRITRGTGHTLREITDAAGHPLYGGYYYTHLVVPPARLLSQFRVWDRVAVGVEVQAFGATLLASTYVLGRPGELDEGDAGRWDTAALPSMRAGNMFYEDNLDGRPAAPRPGALAELPRLAAAPPVLARFRELRAQPAIDADWKGRLGDGELLAYPLVMGRDLRPGHGVMFARFVGIADAMERDLLVRALWPREVVDCLAPLERETIYLGNVRREQTLRGRVTASFARCPPDHHGADATLASLALLEGRVEIFDEDNLLLWASRVRKLLVVPRERSSLIVQAERQVARHAT